MQPNMLFIMSDDHTAKAISAYRHGLNSIPNIDRITTELLPDFWTAFGVT